MTTVAPRATLTPAPRVPTPAVPSLFLVAPASLDGWFRHFVDWRVADDVRYLGEGAHVDLPGIRRALTAGGLPRTAVLLSSHDTLLRDRWLADRLLAAGHPVVSQSARATRLGADKVAMKSFFDQHGFRSPRWRHPGGGTLPGTVRTGTAVVKRRNGTQSTGTRLVRLADYHPAPGELCELYQDGTEYSVVVYRRRGHSITFPPVWKGPTSPRLVPPWQRLRLCPPPDLAPALADDLRRTAAALAEAADADGYLEVELLLAGDGEAHVLEINPRICGTLRIVALATGVPIFSLHRGTYPARVPAVRYAAEVPYRGTPFRDPTDGVYATSRLTVAGDCPQQVRDRLARHGAGTEPAWQDGPFWADPPTTGYP